MEYRRLGKTKLIVSVIGVGTWQLGGEWGTVTQGEVDQIFDRARDFDINLVDTAKCYGDHVFERLVGAAIKRDPRTIEKRLREVQHIEENEVPMGVPIAQWALAWCLRHDAVTCAIAGCRDAGQVELNAAAAALARGDHPLVRPLADGVLRR